MANRTRYLPSVNFRTRLTETDLQFQHDTYSYEIQNRTQILSQFGIISNIDTKLSTSYALKVMLHSNGVDVVVLTGGAVTPGGNIVYSDQETVFTIPTINDEYTIFIEYNTIGVNDRLTIFNTYEPSVFERLEKASALVNAYETDINLVVCGEGLTLNPVKIDRSVNLSLPQLYPIERQNNIVKLATCIKTTSDTPNQYVTQITLDSPELRPWFSANDIYHRSKVGSGVQTPNNIHALAISDLTVGNMTLFDMIQERGFVVSKDTAFPQYSGREVKIQVPYTGSMDTTGIIFAAVENAKIKPNGFYGTTIKPYKIGYVYADDNPDIEFPFDYNFQTGRLRVYGTSSGHPKIDIVAYVVDALTPYDLNAMSTNSLKIKAPSENEVVITGGIAINSLNKDIISFDSNIIPFTFRSYVDEDGNLFINPSIIAMFALNDITANEAQTLTTEIFGTSTIMLGFIGSPSPNFSIEITGISKEGGEITESISITDFNISPYFSVNKFTSITYWKIVTDSSSNIPFDSKMTMYAVRDFDSRRRYAAIADVYHQGSGAGVPTVYDIRDISFTLNPHRSMFTPIRSYPSNAYIIADESSEEMKFVNTKESMLYSAKRSNMFMDGTRSNIAYYVSRMMRIPNVESATIIIVTVRESYPGSLVYLNWQSSAIPVPAPYGSMASHEFATFEPQGHDLLSIDVGLAVGNIFGRLIIGGSFSNYSVAYITV